MTSPEYTGPDDTAPDDTAPDNTAPDEDMAPPAEAAPAGVDAALRQRLDEIASQPLGAQADAYQQLHSELQQSLADIDAS